MKHRLLRVNELLKRELSGIITREMTFETGLVSINQVDVSSDLKNAHVFVSVLGTSGAGVINELEAHRGRSRLPWPKTSSSNIPRILFFTSMTPSNAVLA